MTSLARLRLRLRILLVALRRSGARALLALAAVGLGIAATMILLALSAGAARELEETAARVGRNLFVVAPAPVLALPGRGTGWAPSTRLDRDDVDLLRAGVDGVRAVAPVVEGSRRARLGRQEMVTNVRGVTPEFLVLRNFELAEGRALDERDDRARARVALAGSWVARKLGEGASVVGRTVWVGGIPFEIVGVLAEKGMTDGQNEDDQLLVPLETARRRLYNVESLSRLLVQAESAELVAPVEERTRRLLRASHRLDPDARDDFDLLSLLRVNQIRRQGGVFLRVLSQLFAVTTLAVGGAGVLAVTWLNVKERVAEIGLRLALGARRRDIAALFVAEACVLGVAGGVAGVAAGALAVAALERTLGWRMAIDLRGVVLPLLVSVALGLLSGVLPAARAARITPVDALRDA